MKQNHTIHTKLKWCFDNLNVFDSKRSDELFVFICGEARTVHGDKDRKYDNVKISVWWCYLMHVKVSMQTVLID